MPVDPYTGMWYEGAAPPTPELPAVQPIAAAAPGNQRDINAQTAYLNANLYNNTMNQNLANNYAIQQEAYALNGGRRWVGPNVGGHWITDAPVAPIYTNVNYNDQFNYINSQTPGEPEYGTDSGMSFDPYLRQDPSYWGTLPQFTTANSHIHGPQAANIPEPGAYNSGTNPNTGGRPAGQGSIPGGNFLPGGGQIPGGSLIPGSTPNWQAPTFGTPNNPGLGLGTNNYTPPTFGMPGGIGQVPMMPPGGFPFPWQPPGQQGSPYPSNGAPSVQNWTPPWQNMGGGPPIQGGGGFATGDNFLADQVNDIGYLRGITEGAGYATNVTPAWEAMVEAQQRSRERQAADLAEKFNVMGGRFSTAFGDSMTDFHTQAAKDDNALLGQMTMQAQEAARGRELAAAGQLGALSSQAGQQLSQQDYGARQQQLQAALAASLAAGGGSDQSAMLLAQLGASGAGQLLGNSMQGAGAMFGAENTGALNIANNSNQAAMAMFGAGQQLIPQMMNYDLGLRQQGNSTARSLSDAWAQSLGLGSQLGQQEFGIDSFNLNRVYEEWLRTQPMYNPLIPYLYSGATAQPAMYAPGFKPSQFSQIAGGIGSLLGGAGAFMGGL